MLLFSEQRKASFCSVFNASWLGQGTYAVAAIAGLAMESSSSSSRVGEKWSFMELFYCALVQVNLRLLIVRSGAPLRKAMMPPPPNPLVGSILVEVEPTFLVVIEKVEVLLRKFCLDFFFVLDSSKGCCAADQ